ncbi:MAG TPA: hypothetical protein ENO05_10060, partial [Bacteroides sp.]|nr:hypothetical protein [Bacteroides sp.]
MKQAFRIQDYYLRRGTLLLMLAIALGCVPLKAQDTTMVSGVIKSTRNEPIPDVSVSIEGSSLMPVVTGEDGTFTIPSVTGRERLIISPAADYKMRQVYLNGRDELVIY